MRALAARLGKGLDLVRLTWLEGRIVAGLGRTEAALAAFDRVRAELTTRRIPYDTALVILDVAVLLAEEGRTAEVRALPGVIERRSIVMSSFATHTRAVLPS